MTTYVIRRLSFGAILIFLATIISFAIMKASPGEPGADTLDPRMSQQYLDEQNAVYGDNLPAVQQYVNWLGLPHLLGRPDAHEGLLQAHLGLSRTYHQPVGQVLRPRLLATLSLSLVTLLITWTIALPLGIVAAVHQYRWADQMLSALSFVGMSLPGFFLALLVLWIFASHVQWLPPGGLRSEYHDHLSLAGRIGDYAWHFVVPVVVLTFGALAGLQRITRGNMLETLRLQYVTTARAKGLSEKKVVYKHALRNAINPLVTLLGFEFAGLFSGAALLENVINFPGMGQLMLQALISKDKSVVMAVFLLGSIMLVLGNLLAELLLAWVDPRVRYD